MKQKVHHIVHHSVDFLILVLLLVFGLGGILYFQHRLLTQIIVAITMSILYALWGILHHYHEGNLTTEVSLEYISVAGLVGFVLVIFLFRA